MNSTEVPLTVRQGVVIASRALCFYCLLEAMFNLSYFPGYIGGLQHAWTEVSNLGLGARDNYILGVYVRDLAVGTIRLVIELFLAWWFYRHGPAVAKFLLGDSDMEGTGDADESLETQC